MEIPSLDLDKLKHYRTNEPKLNTDMLNSKEVLSERGNNQAFYASNKEPNFIYGETKREKDGVLSVDNRGRFVLNLHLNSKIIRINN